MRTRPTEIIRPLPYACYTPLLRALRWELIPSVWDPFAALGSTATAFASHPLELYCTDVYSDPFGRWPACDLTAPTDPSLPDIRPLPVGAIVTKPDRTLLPEAWDSFCTAGAQVICFAVDPCAMQGPHTQVLTQLLQRLFEQNCLGVCAVPATAEHPGALWLCRFATPEIKDELWIAPSWLTIQPPARMI